MAVAVAAQEEGGERGGEEGGELPFTGRIAKVKFRACVPLKIRRSKL